MKTHHIILFLAALAVFAVVSCEQITKPAVPDPVPEYTVTYNGMEQTGGTVPTDPAKYAEGKTVTVANPGNLAKTGYDFENWNTKADGTGTTRIPGATFTMGKENVTLYAMWTPEDPVDPTDPTDATDVIFSDTFDTLDTSVWLASPSLSPIGGYSGSMIPGEVKVEDGILKMSRYAWELPGANPTSSAYTVNALEFPAKYRAQIRFKTELVGIIVQDTITCAAFNGIIQIGKDGYGLLASFAYTNDPNNYYILTLDVTETVIAVTIKKDIGGAIVQTFALNADFTKPATGKIGLGGGSNTSGIQYTCIDYVTLTEETDVLPSQTEYTVTYNGNDQTSGSVPDTSEETYKYYKGSVVNVRSNTGNLVKTGYDFAGWNTEVDGSGDTYTAGQSFTIDESNVILYAKWDEAEPIDPVDPSDPANLPISVWAGYANPSFGGGTSSEDALTNAGLTKMSVSDIVVTETGTSFIANISSADFTRMCLLTKMNATVALDTVQYLDGDGAVVAAWGEGTSAGEASGSWSANRPETWNLTKSRLAVIDGRFVGLGSPSWYTCVGLNYAPPLPFEAIKIVMLTDTGTLPPAEAYYAGIQPGSGQLNLQWYPPMDADFDHLEVTLNPGGIVRNVTPSGSGSLLTETFTGLTNGTTYTLTLKTVDTDGNKSEGITVTGTPSNEVTGLTAIPGNGFVTLSWDDPSNMDDLEMVNVTGDGISKEVVPGKKSAVIRGLANDTMVELTVRTKNTSGTTSNGVKVPVTPSASAPQGIFELWSGTDSIQWGSTVNSPGDAGYVKLGSTVDISDMATDKTITVSFTPAGKRLAFYTKNKIVKIDSIQYLDDDDNVIATYAGGNTTEETSSNATSNTTQEWSSSTIKPLLESTDGIFARAGSPTWYTCSVRSYPETATFTKVKVVLLSDE